MSSLIYDHQDSRSSGTIYLQPSPLIVPAISVPETQFVPETPAIVKKRTGIFSFMSKTLGILGIAILAVVYVPSLISNLSSYKPTSREIKLSSKTQNKPAYLPPLDASLPKENTLIIPSIGVKTVLQEASLDNYEEALKKGVWRVSDFGSPDDRSRPTILAAHRYGYIFWSNSFRKLNSFYNLPNLKVGDTVEIDYGQRKYTYEIYSEATDTEITDYTADLILYTCENLTGDMRIFKYARLIVPGS